MPSTVHLKMKYYTAKGQVATLHGDIEAARRCFEASAKSFNSIKIMPRPEAKPTMSTGIEASKLISRIDTIDLDSRLCGKTGERQKTKKASTEDSVRPIPNGDFELIPLGEDPSKSVKIRVDLAELARKQLRECLHEIADLFAWSTPEMPGLDPEVACHYLTIDLTCRVVAQRRRK